MRERPLTHLTLYVYPYAVCLQCTHERRDSDMDVNAEIRYRVARVGREERVRRAAAASAAMQARGSR